MNGSEDIEGDQNDSTRETQSAESRAAESEGSVPGTNDFSTSGARGRGAFTDEVQRARRESEFDVTVEPGGGSTTAVSGTADEAGRGGSPGPGASAAHSGRAHGRNERREPRDWRAVTGYPEADRAPFAMCFTDEAMKSLLWSVGSRRPETGAKGFGPKDRMGFDVVEFDEQGSLEASGAVYRPDSEWGERRQRAHLQGEGGEVRLWTGDLHSHPGEAGRPSAEAGHAEGDLGYVKEVFGMNESMEWFFIPILTNTAPRSRGPVRIHPWVCRRGRVNEPMIAEVRICDPADFPERQHNPSWVRSIGEEPESPAWAESVEEKPASVEEAEEPVEGGQSHDGFEEDEALEPEESEKGRESSGPGRGTRDARLIAALQTARGVTMAARAALLRVEVELIELMLDVLGEDETGDET